MWHFSRSNSQCNIAAYGVSRVQFRGSLENNDCFCISYLTCDPTFDAFWQYHDTQMAERMVGASWSSPELQKRGPLPHLPPAEHGSFRQRPSDACGVSVGPPNDAWR